MTDDTGTTRWLFADQLGPHFDDGGPLLLIEARSVFERRIYHRQKAHLVLSALHHRAADDPERVTLIRSQTYAEGVATYRESRIVISTPSPQHPVRRGDWSKDSACPRSTRNADGSRHPESFRPG